MKYVRAGGRLRDGSLRVDLERRVVVDDAVLVDDAAVAVIGVLVDAEVGHQHDIVAEGLPEVAQRAGASACVSLPRWCAVAEAPPRTAP